MFGETTLNQITSELLQKLAPSTPKAKRDRFIPYFNEALPRYGITSKKRVAAFLATVIMESDYLKATEEYASGWDYDISHNKAKAKGLGNTAVGDGPKYKGRTLIQTTGKKNYKKLSDKLGIDFVANPKKLSQPQYAVEGACVYWQDNNLNSYADKSEFSQLEGLVNRGSPLKIAKDLPKRKSIYAAALEFLPDGFILGKQDTPTPEPEPIEEPTVPDTKVDDTEPKTDGDNVKVSVEDGNVSVETNSTAEGFAKVAVVAAKPTGFLNRLYTKVVAALSGNIVVQTIMGQVQSISGWALSPAVWITITVLVGVFTLVWIISEAVKSSQERKRQAALDNLLVEQNSTKENKAQIIHPDDVAFFAAKGYHIINRGDAIPKEVKEAESGDN